MTVVDLVGYTFGKYCWLQFRIHLQFQPFWLGILRHYIGSLPFVYMVHNIICLYHILIYQVFNISLETLNNNCLYILIYINMKA